MLKEKDVADRVIIDLQHKFRGLEADYRSRKFVLGPKAVQTLQFRSGLSKLLLEARVTLLPSQFERFLGWVSRRLNLQFADSMRMPVGYEELTGVHTGAPVATLERELLWIAARIKVEAPKLNTFSSMARSIERMIFQGDFDNAIVCLQLVNRMFGVSLWSVQLRIALEHLAGGLERQKQYSAEVRGIYKRGLLSFVTYHTSVRNEDKTTLAKYLGDAKARIDRHSHYDGAIKTYLRYRLAGEWPVSELELADVLRVEQSHSLIDIYETFIAVIQELARREDYRNARTTISKCLAGLGSITDFRLAKALRVLNGTVPSKSLSIRTAEISDALFSGDVKNAVKATRRTLGSNEHTDPWQFIYAGFTFAHRNCKKARELSQHPRDIPQLLGNILNRSEALSDPFSQLSKLLTNLRGLPTATGLLDMLRMIRRSNPDDHWQPWLVGLNSATIGVEDTSPIEMLPSVGRTSSYSYALSPTEEAWRCFTESKCVVYDTPKPSFVLLAAALLRENKPREAASLLDSLRKDLRSEPLIRIVISLQLHARYSLGDRQDVIALIADEGAQSNAHSQTLPILSSLKHYSWTDFKSVKVPLAAPIALHLLWTNDESGNTLSLLRYATGHFLRTVGVERPSKLNERAGDYAKHQLLYFLQQVCVENILDASRVLKSSRDVMEERQAICAVLRLLDPANSGDYQIEIASISNQLALEDGRWIVDRTRIYVDTEALLRWAVKALSEDFARLGDLLAVNVGTEQSFDDVLRELETATSSHRVVFTPESESAAVLASIFRRFGDEFLNNPTFGLDYYLSKRIRHQSFIGKIRGPLEFSDLITTRESESGRYHRNDHWLDKFTTITWEAKESLDKAMTNFATKFDEALIEAKDTRFHIRSPEHPSGLLSLDLLAQVTVIVNAILPRITNLEEFVGLATAMMWIALNPSLERAKRFVAEDLKTRIAEAFDELRAAVRRVAEQDPAFLDLDVEIGGRSTEVQRALDEVATWFLHADIEANKRFFKLDQIADIAIESALKCQRAFSPVIDHRVEGDLMMPGISIGFVHDVLFIALDNVRAHSGLKKPHVKILIRASKEDSTLTIDVRSDAKVSGRSTKEVGLQDIRQQIDGGTVGRRTRREGKSGFFKLAAMVRESQKGRIDFGFVDDDQFFLNVTNSMLFQGKDGQGGGGE